ncbi:Kal-1 protein [Perkinsela sp. CCAP 1560/4]|nr:glutathione-S-transferase/glutaredoxin [Perkinsela sp. CCAP 1560/4]KNH06653.1 Kal-1 protein [Perkinsela sp. CCAP 1560/4]|eukprot:KNH04648.1 glutathione-S-transferase/glutaredoxin [Perkinsela sp. CCAP 1560/4]
MPFYRQKLVYVAGASSLVGITCFSASKLYFSRPRDHSNTQHLPISPLKDGPTRLQKLAHNDSSLIHEWLSSTDILNSLQKPNMQSNPNILYQMTTCPFCNKVRTFLNTHRIPFKVVEVDPVGMKGVPEGSYKKVPQFQIGGSTKSGPLIIDSSEIVTILSSPFGPRIPKPSDTDQWRSWANDVLSRYIAIEVGTNFRSSCKFISSHPDLSLSSKVKYLGAGILMFFAAHKVVAPKLEKLGYDTTNTRAALLDELEKWSRRLEQNQLKSEKYLFHGEERPSLADTDVFGTLQSIRGHKIYADIVHFSENKSGVLSEWMKSMDRQVMK